MKQTRLLAFFALCAAGLFPMSLGCQSQVISGQGGSGGEDTGPGGSPSSASGVPTNPAASGKAQPADGGFIVTLANYPSSCGDPGIQPNCGPTDWASAQFQLASSALVPGTVLPFSGLSGFFSEQLAQSGGEAQCGFGGGTFSVGSVKIVAVTTTDLTLEVTGSYPNLDGTYVVPICGSTTTQDDGPAIALKYSETPGNNGDSTASCTSGGPYIDPTTLMIYLSNLGQSCVDPFHSAQGCIDARYQIAIQIPINSQKVGSLPLQGLATVDVSGSTGVPGSCSGGGGSYGDGTIHITAIDATQVKFTLSGTADTGLGLGNADGTYTAPRCF